MLFLFNFGGNLIWRTVFFFILAVFNPPKLVPAKISTLKVISPNSFLDYCTPGYQKVKRGDKYEICQGKTKRTYEMNHKTFVTVYMLLSINLFLILERLSKCKSGT